MTVTLRPYQKDAVLWLSQHPRGILADSPGLGKSFPAVQAAKDQIWKDNQLIVVPAYLMEQWVGVVQQLYPTAHVRVIDRNTPHPKKREGLGWVILSYHTLMTAGIAKQPWLLKVAWDSIIIDEAQRARGRSSQWTKTLWKLAPKARFIWMLTGTPIVNNPGDLWPLLKLCDPKRFRGYWPFVDEWCAVQQTPFAKEITGIKPRSEKAFNKMLSAYMLRRRKEDYLPELPPLTSRLIEVDLSPKLKKMHDTARKEWFIEHPNLSDPVVMQSAGAMVSRLRMLTAGVIPDPDGQSVVIVESAKIKVLTEILDDLPNEPVIVFCWHVATAEAVCQAVPDARRFPSITGKLPPVQRGKIIEEWKRSRNGVLVGSLSAMQEGMNLQHASQVVFVEHDYLPSSLEQAVARSLRFGQDRPVFVTHLVARGTIDASVFRTAHERHRHNLRALLEDVRGAVLTS